MTHIWAHTRANVKTPMNTMRGYRDAVQSGAEGLEIDVRMTADGHLVCAHDDDIKDGTGAVARIGDLSLSEVSRLSTDLGCEIPRLDDVYDLIRPTHLQLNIEGKNRPNPYPDFSQALASSVHRSRLIDRVVVSSFDHRLLTDLRALDATIRRAPLVSDGLVDLPRYLADAGFDHVHLDANQASTPADLQVLHDARIAVRVWTVNKADVWRYLLSAGVDTIITDRPAEALQTRTLVQDRPVTYLTRER